MLIGISWTKVSGVTNPDTSAWEWVVVGAAMLLLIGPIMVWKERWVAAWQWWKSVLFFVGFFCIAIPVVAGGADAILGDNHAKVDADGVVAQVLSARPSPVTRATAIVVQPSEHVAGSTLDVPYQGEGLDYLVDFAAVTGAGRAVQCRATLSLYREQAPRGRSAPVSARMKGGCRAAA
ncbi:hypothetical protein ACXYTP_19070 [Tsukamurella ocularis]|uniref:hypothetical protein n=1 Tax=Tsukamurella ocularis TaxID=1970234 RepID=UPI0039EECD71